MRDIRHVRSGESIRPHLTAHWFNSTLRDPGGAPAGDVPPDVGLDHGGVIWLKNNTQARVNKYAILGVGGSVLTAPSAGLGNVDTFHDKPIFNGETPTTASYWNKPAVCLETIEPGYIGKALVSGVTPAQVSVGHIAHKWADVDGTTETLTSYATGSVRILSTISSASTQWALVQLGQLFKGMLLAKADAMITAGSAGAVSIYDGSRVDTGYNVTAYCFQAITSTSVFLAVEEIDGVYFASPLECQ